MLIIYSKNIVLKEKIVAGYIKIIGNTIDSITDYVTEDEEAFVVDVGESFVMPGFINLGSSVFNDATKECNTREELLRAIRPVIYSYTINGVTRLYHTIKYHYYEQEYEKLAEVLCFIKTQAHITPIDNFVHLKFQIKTEQTTDAIKKLIDDKLVDFLSYDALKDYKNVNMYRDYYTINNLEEKLNLSSEMSDKLFEKLRQLREDVNIDELSYLVKYAHYKGLKIGTSRLRSGEQLLKQYKDAPDILNIKNTYDYSLKNDDWFKLVSSSAIIENFDESYTKELLLKDKVIVASFSNPCDHLLYLEMAEKYMGLPKAVSTISRNPAQMLNLRHYGEIKTGNIADLCIYKKIDDKYTLTNMIKDGKIRISLDI